MENSIRVPSVLLLEQQLSKSAKLIWICLRHLQAGDGSTAPPPTSKLVHTSGLAPGTVRRAVGELRSGGWLTGMPPGHKRITKAVAAIPAELLLDRRLDMQAKLLYGTLQLTPNFQQPGGQFTITDLIALSSTTGHTLRRAARLLRETGWVKLAQRNKYSHIRFNLRNPVAGRRRRELAQIRRRLKRAEHKGEAIMKECLSLLIDCDEFTDNARPGFLVNPFTFERMEFDRYYPPDVAFEFNGAQHEGPTERFPDEAEAKKQRARDNIKRGICESRGVRLVVLHAEDLCLATLLPKLIGLLPLRDLTGAEPLIAELDEAAGTYQQNCLGEEAARAHQQNC